MSAFDESGIPTRPLSPLPNSVKNETTFERARSSFLKLVPEPERPLFTEFDDAATLINHIQGIVSQNPALAQPHPWVHKLLNFTKKIEYYFDVLNIVFSANQQGAAAVWGAIRHILRMCSNYATFFEKVVAFLEHIGTAFREYEYLSMVLKDETRELNVKEKKNGKTTKALLKDLRGPGLAKLEAALCDFYTDLFEFFSKIVYIFRKRDGKPRSRPMVVGNLAWKPFDLRFGDILESFERHRSIVASELELEIKKKESEERTRNQIEREQAERHRNENTFERINSWLGSMRFYEEKFDQVRRTRMPNTSEWLCTESKYIDWLEKGSNNRSQRLLWVNGNPGCGKTILAASAVEDLRTRHSASGHVEGLRCCYFFDQIDPITSAHNSPTDAYRAILTQALKQRQFDQSMLDQFTFFMASPDASGTATTTDLLALLLLCFDEFEPSSIVLDGFDECDRPFELFQFVEELTSETKCKFLIFSRPNVAVLRESVNKENTLCISSSLMERDIRKYFINRLEPLFRKRQLPPTSDSTAITEHLVRVCDGMFMWANLTISYLSSPALSPSDRLDTIWQIQLPEGLDAMYERIIRLIERAHKAEKNLTRRVFMWLMYARAPLTCLQLHDILSLANPTSQTEAPMDYESAIVISCGGLVDISLKSYRFIHLSVKEFLHSNNSVAAEFTRSFHQSDLEISITCLRYLAIKVPKRPLSGRLGLKTSSDEMYRRFPFLPYAAYHWPSHTHEATVSNTAPERRDKSDTLKELISLIECFLNSKLEIMTWIESVYILHSWETCFGQLRSWATYGSKARFRKKLPALSHVADEALDLCKDLGMLHTEWHTTLIRRPVEIWGDITAFTTSRFLESTRATEVNSFATISPWTDAICGVPLCQDTQSSSNGTECAVLSIWPSRRFETEKERFGSQLSDQLLNEISFKWVATYEIWNIQRDLRRLCRAIIPLENAEILAQLQCTLNQGFWNSSWKLQFPTTISATLHTFCILRTIYVLHDYRSDPGPKITPLVLPLDFNHEMARRWPGIGARAYRQPVPKGRTAKQEYTIRICPLSRHICFHDFVWLAVFELSGADGNPKLSLLSYVHYPIIRVERDIFCFHGCLPLLAYAETGSIQMWNFKKQGFRKRVLKTEPDMGYQIKSLNFSKSGQDLVVMSFEDEFPEVISLESYDIYQEAIAEQSTRLQGTRKGKEKALTKFSADETSLTTRSLGILTETSPSGTAARIVHSEDSIFLGLKSPSGVTTGVELLALPQWQHLSETNATVICPKTRQDKINIILTAAADSIFDISETVRRDRAYLPLHVQKDQRAVGVQRDGSRRELFMAPGGLLRLQADEQAFNFVKEDDSAIEIEQGRPGGETSIY